MSKSRQTPASTLRAPRRRQIVQRWLLVLIYTSAIFALSALPGSSLPSLNISDKVVHATEFGILAILLCRAFHLHWPDRSRYFSMLVSILATVGYGVLDESHQWFVAGRTADVVDLAADSLGACLAAWAWVKAGAHRSWWR